MDTPRLITLDEVINSLANRLDDYSMENYQRYLEIAIDGVREFNLFHTKTIKIKKVTVSDINTIDFESDWIKVIDVGIPHNGRLYTFTYDNKMLEPTAIKDGLPAQDTGEGNEIQSDYLTRAGARGGNDFYCRINSKEGRIFVNGYNGNDVYVRYISSGVSMDGITYIPVEAKLALVAYTYYHSIEFMDIPEVRKERARRRLKAERGKLQMLHSPTVEQIRDAYYQGLSGTVNR